MTGDDEDDTPYRRVAVHGDLGELVPETLLTDKEPDAVVEVIYFRDSDEYGVYDRRIYTGVLHLRHGVCEGVKDAATLAIDVARNQGIPIQRRIYTYVPTTDDPEQGEDRIPAPWEDAQGDDV